MPPRANPITYLGRTNTARNDRTFGIRRRDRHSHIAVVGKTGTGKSTLLESIVLQDAVAGDGCALLDPHGDLVRNVLARLPDSARPRLVLLDATDPAASIGFNPLAPTSPDRRSLVAAGIVEVFKKLWSEDWGPRLEHLLRNVVLTLLDSPSSTFADIPRLIADRTFRAQLVADVRDDIVRSFWTDEFDRYSPPFRAVVVAPLQNKLGALLTDPTVRRILVEPVREIDLREVMDQGKILLVNLDKGQIGEGPSATLGSFLVSHLALAAVQRSNMPEGERRDFAIVLDEFQTFTTLSLATMLAELRKFRVGMVLANQHLSQLDPAIRDAVFGNAGTVISFRVGGADAAFLAREFAPTFAAEDLISLPRYHIYIRLLVDGDTARPFSATTLPHPPSQGGR
ncbi:MAG: type IV secretion system DNA-binding domain-containing protein [Gemmatimonadaceae bacterium]